MEEIKTTIPFSKKVYKIIPLVILVLILSSVCIFAFAYYFGYKFVILDKNRFISANIIVLVIMCGYNIVSFCKKPKIKSYLPALLPSAGLVYSFFILIEVQADIITKLVIIFVTIISLLLVDLFCAKGIFLKIMSVLITIGILAFSGYIYKTGYYKDYIQQIEYFNIQNIYVTPDSQYQVIVTSDINKEYSVYYSQKRKNIKGIEGNFIKVKSKMLISSLKDKPKVDFKDNNTICINDTEYNILKKEP